MPFNRNINIEMHVGAVVDPCFFNKALQQDNSTTLRGDWHQYVLLSDTTATRSVPCSPKAVAPCLISLMRDPWRAPPPHTHTH